jgi:hypothetical protein
MQFLILTLYEKQPRGFARRGNVNPADYLAWFDRRLSDGQVESAWAIPGTGTAWLIESSSDTALAALIRSHPHFPQCRTVVYPVEPTAVTFQRLAGEVSKPQHAAKLRSQIDAWKAATQSGPAAEADGAGQR